MCGLVVCIVFELNAEKAKSVEKVIASNCSHQGRLFNKLTRRILRKAASIALVCINMDL